MGSGHGISVVVNRQPSSLCSYLETSEVISGDSTLSINDILSPVSQIIDQLLILFTLFS